jgi:hypothetical protein
MRRILLAAVCSAVLALGSISSMAQDEQAGKEVGDWWTKSALSYNPVLSQWLFHVEATMSYQDLSGNTDGSIYSIAPQLTVRKGQVSNYLGYNLAKQDVAYANGGSVNMKTALISEDLRYEFLEWLFVGAGYRNLEDDLTYVDNRDTYFGGAGVSWSAIKDKLTFAVFLAYGQEDTGYISDTGLPDEDSAGIFVQPTVQYAITDGVSLSGSGTYLEYMEDEMGKRWDVDVSLSVVLAPHVSLTLAFNKKYENNVAIRNDPEAENTTTTQMIGLTFSY